MIVRWQPPPPEAQNGIIVGYKIRYKAQGSRRGDTVVTDGNRNSYALTGELLLVCVICLLFTVHPVTGSMMDRAPVLILEVLQLCAGIDIFSILSLYVWRYLSVCQSSPN